VYNASGQQNVTLLIKNTGTYRLAPDGSGLDVVFDGQYIPPSAADGELVSADNGAVWSRGDVLRLTINVNELDGTNGGLADGDHRVYVTANGDEELFQFRVEGVTDHAARQPALSARLGERDRLNKELGGDPRGSIVLMEGDYGAGKSAISQRFAYGLVEEGASVTVMSTELTVRGFIDQMHSLEYDMVKPLLQEELLFLHADFDSGGAFSDDDGERKGAAQAADERRGDVELRCHLPRHVRRNLPERPNLRGAGSEKRGTTGRRPEIISFFREIISQGKVVVLTVDPSAVDDDAIGPFRSIADVFLQLEMIEVGNDIRRQINVKRFAGMGEQVGDTIGFSVRSGTGIVIESRSVACACPSRRTAVPAAGTRPIGHEDTE